MKRLIHLSDLHFGRDNPDLVAVLRDTVNALAPDLVAISGDLTQRARHSQFQRARAFIDGLAPPVLCVPGNHDVPLENLFVRFLMPWRRYRRWIARDLEPVVMDDETLVVGINTVNPFAHQRGRFSKHAMKKVRAQMGKADERMRVVVLHHPLEQAPGATKELMEGAGRAIMALSDCGADIVLSGHLHSWGAALHAQRAGGDGVVQVQAGTGLSTRTRGEQNDFNLLSMAPGTLRVERYVADPDGSQFRRERVAAFEMGEGGWVRTVGQGAGEGGLSP